MLITRSRLKPFLPKYWHEGGFSLVVTLLLMVLLTIAAIGLLGLSTLQLRRGQIEKHEANARARARLAMQMAIGQLQQNAGPDTRATADASLIDQNISNPHWTGVWNTRRDQNLPWQQRDDSSGGLSDMRGSSWNPEKTTMTWLVSGNRSPRDTLPNDLNTIELVSEKADNFGKKRVIVPRVTASTRPDDQGGLAWWVGDLGIRANLSTPDAFAPGDSPTASTPVSDFRKLLAQEADSSFSGSPSDAATKRKLVSEATRKLSANQPRASINLDYTAHSAGVLADMANGGLKRNLTAYFESNGSVPPLRNLPGLNDSDNLVGPSNSDSATQDGLNWNSTRHRFTSPKFGLLRRWAKLDAPQDQKPVPAQPPKAENSPRISQSNSLALSNLKPAAIASLDTPSLSPILVEGSLSFTMSWHRTAAKPGGGTPLHPYQVRLHLYPRVVLWNPYNLEMELQPTIAMIQGNGRQEMWSEAIYPNFPGFTYLVQWIWFEGGRSTNFTPINGNITQSEGYKDPYVGCFYFALPKTRFKPGECLVFTPDKAAEYNRPIAGASNTYALEKNTLTCEKNPDPSRNYYLSDNEVDGGIDFIPTRYWFAPITWLGGIANQADDCRIILKSLEGNSNLTFEKFDALPQISIVSASLQFGAGREPRIAWSGNEKMPCEQTDTFNPKASIAPNVRTREGIRLRWHRETLSNLKGSGGLANTAHFEEALLANWNPRAAYATRSPWDNLAGTLPKSGTAGGPWFFGAYTRDLYDQAVSWQDQMPVYRDGRYHGNPFGTPQESPGPMVLFDVPRQNIGVVSLGQLQHVKLSEFIWHPSYAIGQSLADPRGRNGKNNGLRTSAPVFASSTEVNQGGFHAEAIGSSTDTQRAENREAWAKQARAVYQDYPESDSLVYDLSYEVNRTLWDTFFLTGANASQVTFFTENPQTAPLPNGRLHPIRNPTGLADELNDFHRAASLLLLDGAFNVNSTRVEAWKAVLAGNRAANHGKVCFPRVFDLSGVAWSGNPTASETWNSARTLSDNELDRLARTIVDQVRLRGPFLSLADFINRRLTDDETGRMGPLQAAIEKAGLNSAFQAAFPLDNTKSLPDYKHPDQIQDATRLEQTLKPDSKAWGAPSYLTQGDILQVIGPMLNARSDTFVIRSYGDSTDSNGRVVSRAWCEAIVQRTPEPIEPDPTGLNSAQAGQSGDFGRRFVITSFRWLHPDEI